MSDLELEVSNIAATCTVLGADIDWEAPKLPVFRLYREDESGYGMEILTSMGGLYCDVDKGVGARFSGGTNGVYATGRNDHGVYAEASAQTKAGVFGLSKAATAGFGVVGQVTGSNGIGVSGEVVDVSGVGVRGTAKSGIGVQGATDSGVGVHGSTDSGPGVQGVAKSGNGVEGFSSAPGHAGVLGNNDAKEGTSYGVLGTIKSSNGAGVYGASEAAGSCGVLGSGGAGTGVLGSSGAGTGVFGSSGGGIGVFGSGNSQGVFGYGKTIAGVTGWSDTGHGVFGNATSQTKFAVYGINSAGNAVGGASKTGAGVLGTSVSNNAVAGFSWAPLDVHRISVDPVSAGVAGVAATGVGVLAASLQGANAVGLYATAPTTAAIFKGNVVVDGTLFVTTGNSLIVQTPENKSGVVTFADGSQHLVCAIESPEAWLEDFGEAVLVKGKAHVALDPPFAHAVDVGRFHVFITPYGETAGLYVSRRTRRGFDVAERKPGKSSLRFSWRVVARPKSAKNKRFAKTTIPEFAKSKGNRRPNLKIAMPSMNGIDMPAPPKMPKPPKRAIPKLPEPPKLPKPSKLPKLPTAPRPSIRAQRAMAKARKSSAG
jgi:hypothetical protein